MSLDWDDLYRQHGERLHRIAYRLTGNRQDSADLVHETFVRAIPRMQRIAADELDPGAYLTVSLRNIYLKERAKSRRAIVVADVPETDDLVPIEDDPERSALLRSQQHEVRLANDKLAPRQRVALALREIDGQSYAQIGQALDLNENAVAQLISRARLALRRELRLVQVPARDIRPECEERLEELAVYADGGLSANRKELVDQHLDECEECRRALAAFFDAGVLYRTLIPAAVGVAAVHGQIAAAMPAAGATTPVPTPPGGAGSPRNVAFASVAASVTLAALAFGAVTLSSGGSESKPVPVRVAAAQPPPVTAKRPAQTPASSPSPAPRRVVPPPAKRSAPAPPAVTAAPQPAPARPAPPPRPAPVAPKKPAPSPAPPPQPPVAPSEPPTVAGTPVTVEPPPPAPPLDEAEQRCRNGNPTGHDKRCW